MDRKDLEEKYGIDLWDDQTRQDFRETLLAWYDQEKRDLPWRQTKDPYKIWVSEIMLQQTQVATVIPYYEKFIQTYPDIKSLAESNEDDLLRLWQGLGYYSRARNMRQAAQQIMEDYGGHFPKDPKEIKKLKGIGPYTSGAIASMAFDQAEPAVDGNLMRVLARVFEVDLDVKKPSNRKVFEALTKEIIDPERPGDFNQAMMDLGATISTPKNYNPELSPIKEFDQSYLNDTWRRYPVASSNKKAKKEVYLALLVKDEDGDYLVEKQPAKGLLANLWLFPIINLEDLKQASQDPESWQVKQGALQEVLDQDQVNQVQAYFKDHYHLPSQFNQQVQGQVSHAFSHLNWSIYLLEGQVESGQAIPDQCEWLSPDQREAYAFPKVQEKIWETYFNPSLF